MAVKKIPKGSYWVLGDMRQQVKEVRRALAACSIKADKERRNDAQRSLKQLRTRQFGDFLTDQAARKAPQTREIARAEHNDARSSPRQAKDTLEAARPRTIYLNKRRTAAKEASLKAKNQKLLLLRRKAGLMAGCLQASVDERVVSSPAVIFIEREERGIAELWNDEREAGGEVDRHQASERDMAKSEKTEREAGTEVDENQALECGKTKSKNEEREAGGEVDNHLEPERGIAELEKQEREAGGEVDKHQASERDMAKSEKKEREAGTEVDENQALECGITESKNEEREAGGEVDNRQEPERGIAEFEEKEREAGGKVDKHQAFLVGASAVVTDDAVDGTAKDCINNKNTSAVQMAVEEIPTVSCQVLAEVKHQAEQSLLWHDTMVDSSVAVLVIDLGSSMCRVGFAGADAPKATFSSVIGRPRKSAMKTFLVDNARDFFVGKEAQEKRGILTLDYPVKGGICTDWDAIEKIWHHTFLNELGVKPKEHPVLLTEPSLNPKSVREKLVQVMFETFGVPGLYLASQAVLSLFASGRSTGVVLHSGESFTHIVPIYEGHELPHAIVRLELAGHDLTAGLAWKLQENNDFWTNSRAHHKDIYEIARYVKENVAYVARDFEEEERNANSPESFQISDGQLIHIGKERFLCPEALFRPDILGKDMAGVHETVKSAIQKCHKDMTSELYNNIVLCGGTTMLPGFEQRLSKEIEALAPTSVKVHVHRPCIRSNCSWIGGSLLASQPSFQQMCISKHEYDESGPSIVHAKCF